MNKILKQTSVALLSLALFMLSNGLFMTLVSVRLHVEGFTSISIGIMGSAFYAGLFAGSFKIESFIARVGHIRAYSAFASALAVLSILHGLYLSIGFWLVLRLISGFCTAGLYIVIESWLLVMSSKINRGRVLAIYMVVLYAAQATGQFLIQLSDPKVLVLFAVGAMLCSLSVIPLAMTKTVTPAIEEPSMLGFKKLYKKTASGMIGCFCAGLIIGPLYTLLPLFIVQKLGDDFYVSLFMAIVIFGGMAMQYPVGKLSDIIERRKVLMFLNLVIIVLSPVIGIIFNNFWLAVAFIFIFGGMVFTIYPVSISYACDSLSEKDITAGTQALLLAYSVGSTIGPLLVPFYMRVIGTDGLFYYFATVNVLMLFFIGWRRFQHEAVPQEEDFIPVVQTSPVLNEIDPRTD